MPSLVEKHPEYFEMETMDINKRLYEPDMAELVHSQAMTELERPD